MAEKISDRSYSSQTESAEFESVADKALSDVSSLAGSDTPADGELGILIDSLDDSSELLPKSVVSDLKRSFSGFLTIHSEAVYRQPLSPEEANTRLPSGGGGLGWYATIVPDEFVVDGKLIPGLNRKDFDLDSKTIKQRRATIPVKATDFFGSLTKVDNPSGSRHVFYGILNGWPGLRCFEVERIDEQKRGLVATPMEFFGKSKWATIWSSSDSKRNCTELQIADSRRVHRVKLRAAPWTALGWSRTSPGYVFWYEPFSLSGPRVSYGTDMLQQVADEKCQAIHMVSHRYAVKRETPRNKVTYHSLCLLEWEHGTYCTVVEAAYLNGIGGYKGKSNWYDDRDEGITALYRSLPPEMICPWRTTSAEIRCYDVESKSLDEFKAYIAKYEGNDKRFIDPHFSSYPARLTFRSKKDLAQYLINYISRDSRYGELRRNCQTFTADFCSFVAGKRGIVPFHPVSRVEYKNRNHLFLYDSHLYENNKDEKTDKKRKGYLSSFR